MLMRKFSSRSKFAVLAAACIVVVGITLVFVSSSVTATSGCRPVNGHLDSVAADLDGNPATLDTAGTLIGGIQADFEFRNFNPVPSGVLPNVLFYTGSIELVLQDGSVLSGVDTGVLDATTGELAELTTFIEKDGVAGDFGRVTISGAFDLVAGVGDSDYSGQICF